MLKIAFRVVFIKNINRFMTTLQASLLVLGTYVLS